MTYAPKRLFITRPSFRNDDVTKWPCDVTHGNDHVHINDDPFPDPCSNFQPDRSRNTRARAKKPQKWAKISQNGRGRTLEKSIFRDDVIVGCRFLRQNTP